MTPLDRATRERDDLLASMATHPPLIGDGSEERPFHYLGVSITGVDSLPVAGVDGWSTRESGGLFWLSRSTTLKRPEPTSLRTRLRWWWNDKLSDLATDLRQLADWLEGY